ncbi:hypothetical protein D3C80_942120 [compost metagenome]
MGGDQDGKTRMGVDDALSPVQRRPRGLHLQRQVKEFPSGAVECLVAVQPIFRRAAIPGLAEEMARSRPEVEAPGTAARKGFGGAGAAVLGPPGIVVVVVVAGDHAEGQAAAAEDRDRAVGDVPFLAGVEVAVFPLGAG